MFSDLHKTCGQEECRDGTCQVRSGRTPVGMRLRRQGICSFARARRVYEFQTTGCIVSCRFSSDASPGLAAVAPDRFPGLGPKRTKCREKPPPPDQKTSPVYACAMVDSTIRSPDESCRDSQENSRAQMVLHRPVELAGDFGK
jgi:hypothetical protein